MSENKKFHDPDHQAFELRDQLSSSARRVGFFFGAGTSMAAGISGIEGLTQEVLSSLEESDKAQIEEILTFETKDNPNIEDALNRLRLMRALIGNSSQKLGSLDGTTVRQLDHKICRLISQIVANPGALNLSAQHSFASWLRPIARDWPVEIFTTNYDTLIEQTLEEVKVLFFDGFVGAKQPFFAADALEGERLAQKAGESIPRSWVRLWKLHGSVGWYRKDDRVVRVIGHNPEGSPDHLIFPTQEKYEDSRKLPFIAYQDQLRWFLGNGEVLLIVAGYSWSDQHIT